MKYSADLKEIICKECHIPQPVGQFRICKTPKQDGFYMSYGNVCETCNRKKRIDKYNATKKNDPEFKRMNKEKSSHYNRSHPEKIKQQRKKRYYADIEETRRKARERHKKYVAEGRIRTDPAYTKMKNDANSKFLTDTYVKHRIKQNLGPETIVTPEMIIVKRQELELSRTERILKQIVSLVPKEQKPRGVRPVSEKNLADHKICNTCKIDQPIDNFTKSKTLRRKLHSRASQCKSCRNEYRNKWRNKKRLAKKTTIHIIPFKDQPICEQYWGVKVGNIYTVTKTKWWRKQPIWYYINVIITDKNNNLYGQQTEIRIKPAECKIIEL